MSHWVGFNALQMHSHVQGEIARRRIIEANHLPGHEHEAWEARIRRELRSDAVFALAFHPDRASTPLRICALALSPSRPMSGFQ